MGATWGKTDGRGSEKHSPGQPDRLEGTTRQSEYSTFKKIVQCCRAVWREYGLVAVDKSN
jgi:hypothetical protein